MNNIDITNKQHDLNAQMREGVLQRESQSNVNEVVNETTSPNNTSQMPNQAAAPENRDAGLGKVDMKPATNVNSKRVGKEELNRLVQSRLGYITINKETLPTKGAFYSPDMKIEIRSAKTIEIKDFSLMDETNPLDINDKINNIISFCTKITLRSRKGTFKDLVEDDKMYIILSIRELTFPQGESKLNLKSVCHSCDFENSFELRTQNLHYYKESELIGKYYDDVERVYNVKTKKYGVIQMSPSKIGVAQQITDYARTKQEAKQKWDKAAINILPYLHLDWLGLNDNTIHKKLIELETWDKNKFALVYRLTEVMKSAINQKLEFHCERCGTPIKVDVEIEGGMKSLFIKHDIEDDLM